jgi:putative transposase
MTEQQGEIGIQELCELARVSRASYYRYLRRSAPEKAETELRDQVQRICLEHRYYGYRRVAAELVKRGLGATAKKVRRLMAEDNLLAIRKRKWVSTANGSHRLPAYPNLANLAEPDGPDQLWVADLTYIRLRSVFVFLAVVLDAWSRRVVGWALGTTLTASLPKRALLAAIDSRRPQPGVIHHSDQGAQYACSEYASVLDENQIIGSMSRPGTPWDNARCESFIKTLKKEEIHCTRYNSIEELRRALEVFIDDYYNHKRLHSALQYRTPVEFETRARE